MKNLRLLLVCVLCLSVVPVAADDPVQANRLLVEAVQLIQAAEAEKAATEKLSLLESALAKLNEIVKGHPGTDLAVKLITGQEIGNLSLKSVKTAITALRLEANQTTVEARRRYCLEALDFSDPICLTVYAQEVEYRVPDESQRVEAVEALAILARAQAVAGDPEGAEQTLNKALAIVEDIVSMTGLPRIDMKKALALVVNGAVHAYSGDLQNALSGIASKFPNAVRNIRDMDYRNHMLALGVMGLASSGSLPEVIMTMLKEHEDISTRVQLLAVAAMKQALLGHVEEALATAETALSEAENAGASLDKDAYLAAGAIVLALSGEPGDEVRAAVGMMGGAWAEELAYMAVALADARDGNLQEARSALSKLRSRLFAKEQGLAGIRLMHALAGHLQEGMESEKLAQTSEALVGQIRVLASLSAFESGTRGKQPDGMIPARPDMPSLRSRATRPFVLAQMEAGNLQAASAIAEAVPDAGIGKELREELARLQEQVDLKAHAEDYLRAGSFQDALEAVKLIEDTAVRDSLLLDTARGLLQEGNSEGAQGAANLIENASDRDLMLNDIVDGLLEKGNFENALAVAKTISMLAVQGRLLVKAVHLQVRNGDLGGALVTATAIQDDNSRDHAFLAIVEARAPRQEDDTAVTLEIVKGIKTAEIHDQALTAIFNRHLQDGDLESAVAVARLIEDNEAHDNRLDDIVQAQVKAGDLQAAASTAGYMHDAGRRDSVRDTIVKINVQAGDLENALAVAHLIEHHRTHDERLGDIVQAQMKAEDLQAAVSTAALMHDEGRRDSVRSVVVDVYLRSGDLESALALARLIADDTGRFKRIYEIAEAYLKAGNLEQGLSVADLMGRYDWIDDIRVKAVGIHIQSEDLDSASALAESIVDTVKRDNRYYNIAEAYLKAGKLERALSMAELIQRQDWRDSIRDAAGKATQ